MNIHTQTIEEVIAKLYELDQLLVNDNYVGAEVIVNDIKQIIRVTRSLITGKIPLRYGFGNVFDVLSFTPLREFPKGGAKIIINYLKMFLQNPDDSEISWKMRRVLDTAGFNLWPLMVEE